MQFYSLNEAVLLAALLTKFARASIRGVNSKVEETGRELFGTTPRHTGSHSPPIFHSRIVGGENAPSGAYKFMVNWDGNCGGSLIAPDLVLTAAHCAGTAGGVSIGSDFIDREGVTRSVSTECKHPSYDSTTLDNDYLILKLNQPVDTNAYKVIQLNSDASVPQENDMLTVIGFGNLSEGGSNSDRLQQVQVPANSHATCSSQYDGIKENIHLCAGFAKGGKDTCQNDSGGPIFEIRNGAPIQLGVVSYGRGCARPNKSGVYARVSGVHDWIQSTMTSLQAGNGCAGGDGSGGSGGGTASCQDQPNWHDGDGAEYDCEWYAQGSNCNDYGDSFPNLGSTAKQACCVCGRSSESAGAGPGGSGGGPCSNNPANWHDSDGTNYDCAWYAQGDNCAAYGDRFENFGGKTAKDACCACGGGTTN